MKAFGWLAATMALVQSAGVPALAAEERPELEGIALSEDGHHFVRSNSGELSCRGG